MATTKRESILGKEKRGTLSSNSSIPHGQRRPSAGTTEKQVPNYLRPSANSRSDATKNVIKTGTQDTTQKPNPLRRRSFDKPPSVARVHKALSSPGPQKSTAIRSASSSSKSATAPKATLERVAKKPNAVKPQTLSTSRSTKKTPPPTTRKASTSSASKKPPSSHDNKEAENLESKHEKEEILDHQVEEVVKDDQGEIDHAEMPKLEESEHPDVVDTTEVKTVEEGKDNISEISTISEEHNVPQTQTEEMEDKIHEEKSDHTQHDEDKENHSKEEINVGHDQEKIPHEETKTETEDKGQFEVEDKATDKVAAAKEIGEEKHLESWPENDEGSKQGLESSEEIVEGLVEESEPKAANVVANANAKCQEQGGHGKKGSPTPYNDVIEETASKLLEERKNKVKALVGAFETVIDKETSNTK